MPRTPTPAVLPARMTPAHLDARPRSRAALERDAVWIARFARTAGAHAARQIPRVLSGELSADAPLVFSAGRDAYEASRAADLAAMRAHGDASREAEAAARAARYIADALRFACEGRPETAVDETRAPA